VIRKRLPLAIHEQVFAFVLEISHVKKLLKGKTTAVDSTLLEANAAMKSIVRKDTGDDWKEYLRKLAAEAGLDHPTDEALRKFDQGRKDKKVSNEEWVSTTDPDSRIARMKDGSTHLAYKAEHAVDLESDLIVSATVHPGDRGDSATLAETLTTAQVNMVLADSEAEVKEVVADKGYHAAETLAWCEAVGVRTYIPERDSPHGRRWTDKPEEYRHAVYGNRRRIRGDRGKRLSRRRSEYVERTFAHVCETGGARRSWLRGLINVTKRYLMYIAAKNLGVMMRALFNMGTPRSLQGPRGASRALILDLWMAIQSVPRHFRRIPTSAPAFRVVVSTNPSRLLAA
jgi:hypothetical protein